MKNILRISGVILLILSIFFIHSCKKEKPTPPTLITMDVTAISYTTATSGGNVTKDGGSSVISLGVCWNTSADPTINNSRTTEIVGAVPFTSNISQLTSNTTYYVKAYATNVAGTGYGNQVSFTTMQIAVPVLSTTAITSISSATAVSGGNITDDKGGSVIARGVCWSTTTSPTTANSKTTDGTGTGSFISNLASLQPGTIYYVRSYATNSVGTAYGNEISFTTSSTVPNLTTTAVTSITQTTATSGGNITSDGGSTVTARGVCWSKTSGPTTALSTKTTETGTTGTFISSITGLTIGTTYYVRAYATNSVGTSYGNEISFTTTSAIPLSGNITSQTNVLCFGSNTGSVTVLGANGTSPYEYKLGAGIYQASGTFSSISAGTYTVTVRDALLNTFNVNVTIVQPSAALTVTTTIINVACFGGITGSSTATPAGGTGSYTYSWNTTPIQTTSTVIGLSTGTYSVIVTDANNCSATTNVTIAQPTSALSVSIISQTNVSAFGGNNGSVTVAGVGGTAPHQYKLDAGTYQSTGIFGTLIAGTYNVTVKDANLCTLIIPVTITQPASATTVTDIDGNIYNTITIGTQTWLAENLITTKYNDGTAIPLVTNGATWSTLTTGAYCDYENTPSISTTYGRLYNWYVVDNNAATKVASNGGKNVCPTGWHVPSNTEWTTLIITYLGDEHGAGGKLKETGTIHWLTPNTGATNETGFTALPGGFRYEQGTYSHILYFCFLWNSTEDSATNAEDLEIIYNTADVYSGSVYKVYGCSVRCVKDN